MQYEHDISNATLTIDKERSVIRVDYPNERQNHINVTNERGEDMIFHLSHMLWKVKAEHNVSEHQYDAELQVYHIQFATNRKVALSLLFDTREAEDRDPARLKTCFVDAFDFTEAASVLSGASTADDLGLLDVPLREFIDFVPQDRMIYYEGSETEPPCSETVTWIVNLTPHVITEEQRDQLLGLLNEDVQAAGGNYRGA